MKLQVLLSTMHQKDHSILDIMNIKTSAIVINQSDEFKREEVKHRGSDVLFLTLPERGVGLSRNTALMRSDADVALLSDGSVRYDDNYETIILDAFERLPKADMIVFNVPCEDLARKTFEIKKEHRVRRYNSLRYGAVRIAIRVNSIHKTRHTFSLEFGGGAKYLSGEDSIFVYEAIGKGLKVYAVPSSIGMVSAHKSTWFEGYTDRFFNDKGALFKALSPHFSRLLVLQFALRRGRRFTKEKGLLDIIKLMNKGANEYR